MICSAFERLHATDGREGEGQEQKLKNKGPQCAAGGGGGEGRGGEGGGLEPIKRNEFMVPFMRPILLLLLVLGHAQFFVLLSSLVNYHQRSNNMKARGEIILQFPYC